MGTPYRLGLTGGMGSGKSTVARLFMEAGATVIDADAISRATTAAGGVAIAPLAQEFGPDILTTSRALDRDKMRALAFSDPAAKARLESIVHPLVGQEIARQTQTAVDLNAPCLVYDIPLLVESRHWRHDLQRILVVDCGEETQIARVMARDGLPRHQVQAILANQVSRLQRLKAADMVLLNDGILLAELALGVREISAFFGL
jgi:dephospho-CoA kinase